MRGSGPTWGTRVGLTGLAPLAAALSLALAPAGAQATPAIESAFETNGDVFAIARAGSTTYIGGDFTELARADRAGGAPGTSPASGTRFVGSPVVSGARSARAPPTAPAATTSAASFTHVGGVARNNIAHILADGTVDPAFNPNANGRVDALAVSARRRLRRRRLHGRTRSAARPQPDREALGDERQRLLGFEPERQRQRPRARGRRRRRLRRRRLHGDSIGGQARNRIAKLSATSGNAFSAWNPNANDTVRALAVSGARRLRRRRSSRHIGGQTAQPHREALGDERQRLLGLEPERQRRRPRARGRRATPSTPAASSAEPIGGQDRNRIAKLSATSGNAFSGLNPNANGTVRALAVSGAAVYAGGDFTSIGGQPRNRIAKLSATSGNAFSAFDPNADGSRQRARGLGRAPSTPAASFNTVNPVSAQQHRRARLDRRPDGLQPERQRQRPRARGRRRRRLRRRRLHGANRSAARRATGSRSSRRRAATPSRPGTRTPTAPSSRSRSTAAPSTPAASSRREPIGGQDAQPHREALGDERQRLLGLEPERQRHRRTRSRSTAAPSTPAATSTARTRSAARRATTSRSSRRRAATRSRPGTRTPTTPSARSRSPAAPLYAGGDFTHDRRPGAQPDRQALGDERQRLLGLEPERRTAPSTRSRRRRRRRLRRRPLRRRNRSAARRATTSRSSRRRAATPSRPGTRTPTTSSTRSRSTAARLRRRRLHDDRRVARRGFAQFAR